QVIDIPSLPDRRSGIPRWAVVVIAGAAGFLWVCFVLAWLGWLSLRARDGDEKKAYDDVVAMLGKDLESIRRILRL
ncbi:MAG TPA: hypothetical protein VLA34_00085, partial [Candidatus Krumholzibacterium sp.]|nr:hypothetical protein [Candidatus Krumholzibacterium sp.]